MHLTDEQERDFIAYIYLCRYVYYRGVQKTLSLRKSLCNQMHFYLTTLIFLVLMHI